MQRVVGCTVDCTAQRAAEDALRESEQRLRALFTAIDEGYCLCEIVLDERGQPVDYRFEVNPLFEAMTGLKDAVGRSAYALLPDLAPHWLQTYAKVALEGEALRFESGSEAMGRWFDVFAAPVAPCGRFALVFRDVTARKRAEGALSESERRFRVMADGVPVIIWVADAQGRIEFVNREYCAFFGVTVEQVQREGWQPLLHPDDAEAYVSAFFAALASQRGFQARARARHASGHWRWIESSGQPRFSAHGEFIGHVGSSPDVTALMTAQQALCDADRRKDEFLSMLSHELRNPLAAIQNAAQLLSKPELKAAQLVWLRDVMQRQVGQMPRLPEDLLDVARVTQGKLTLHPERTSFKPIIDMAVETARPLIDDKQHRLALELPAEMLIIEADPARLAQVVSNLLTNAAKYTDPGGRIELVVRVEPCGVVIRVRDNGIGIPAEALDRIFDLFSQVSSSLHRSQGGLGIGLALVKGLVESHGGRIEARSDGEGRGEEFTVHLPLPPAQDVSPAPGKSGSLAA